MDDRHLPASERKRQRLRAQGDVAKSHEANSTLVFLTLMVVGSATASGMMRWYEQFALGVWQTETSAFTDAAALQGILAQLIFQLLWVFGSAALACGLCSFAINFLQTRKIFRTQPRQNIFDSIGGSIRQWFSLESPYAFLVGIAKVLVVGGIVYFVLRQDVLTLFEFGSNNPRQWLEQAIGIVFKASFASAMTLVGFGLLDYGWRRWRYEQRIMMTSEEQREEIREIQMDPQLVQRRRQQNAR